MLMYLATSNVKAVKRQLAFDYCKDLLMRYGIGIPEQFRREYTFDDFLTRLVKEVDYRLECKGVPDRNWKEFEQKFELPCSYYTVVLDAMKTCGYPEEWEC